MLLRQHAQELTRRFLAWEIRGRGRTLYPAPVSLEPPFRPFFHRAPASQELDDGRRHTLLSWIAESFSRREKALPPAGEEEPDPEPYHEGELAEFSLHLPRKERLSKDQAEGFLRSLLVLEHPLAWEISGEAGRIRYSVAVRERDRRALAAATSAFLPGVTLVEGAPRSAGNGEPLVTEFCLAEEFLVPLGMGLQPDPLLPLLSLFSQTKSEEALSFQVLFIPARRPWRESVLRAVRTPAGESFFSDFPQITRYAEEKVSSPLFAACLRIAASAPSRDRRRELSRLAAGALANLGRENKLFPLSDNPNASEDFLLRRSHRTGMLLSLPELAALVHLPSSDIGLPGIERGRRKEKAPPPEALQEGVFLGEVSHDGRRSKVFLSEEARMRHVHILGSSGSGKSTLLVSMILEDIAQGHGVGVVDCHGDLVDEVLARVPENRAGDVILFDPADSEYAVGWNILSASSDAEKEMLSSDLVAVFRRLCSTSWGDNINTVLFQAVLAFLESEEGGTLSDLRRFLSDPGFRKSFLATVRDPHAKDFWTTEYPLIKGKPEGSILTRLDALLRNRLVRGVVTAREKPIDFRRAVDDGRIILAKLSQGAIGMENAALLGALLVSKLHQVCLLRQDQEERERRPFYLYLDEFHNLATPSMATLFSGMRKYRLAITAAHQNLYQLRSTVPEVERAVLGNAYTRICFNLGVDEDVRAMSQGFSAFSVDDLGNLGIGEAIVRIGRKEHDFCLRTVLPERENPEALAARRRDLRARSLRKWGVPRQAESGALQSPSPVERREPQAVSPSAAREARPAIPEEPLHVKQEPEAPARPSQPEEPRLPGKGGPEHTYLQELIRRWAEEKGFRAVVEEQIAGTRESIDVALYRGEMRIACEITVTTPLEYEAGNVAKCLAAEFGWVAMVSLKKGRLQKLEGLLSKSLSPEQYERVKLFTPEEFLSWLSDQPVQEEAGTVGGYKVKVRYKTPENARHNRVAEIVARSMSRLKKEG